jgi:Putative transposase DNA-binding domain
LSRAVPCRRRPSSFGWSFPSRQPVKAATSSASTSGFANYWPPARSRRSARIGGRSRRGFVGAVPEANASGARIARDHYINHAVKQLPWHRLLAIGFEDLNGLKRGKSPTRGKNFRIAAAPWTYRRVRQRIECLALENRVLPVAVDPRGISRTCPACGEDDRRNRTGEVFRCIACGHKGDVDFVGARNISTKILAALGRVLFPGQKMSVHQSDVSGQTVRRVFNVRASRCRWPERGHPQVTRAPSSPSARTGCGTVAHRD